MDWTLDLIVVSRFETNRAWVPMASRQSNSSVQEQEGDLCAKLLSVCVCKQHEVDKNLLILFQPDGTTGSKWNWM